MHSPFGSSKLQGASPVLSGVTCVGGYSRSQTRCLSPATPGAIQTGVYFIFPSPRGRTHCGVVFPLSGLLPHCQACGAALMGSGQGCISRGGSANSTGAGGVALGRFHQWTLEGRALQHQEGGSPFKGMDQQKHTVAVCVVQASSLTGIGSV